MASLDKSLGVSSILIWNYSDTASNVTLHLNDFPWASEAGRVVLDPTGANSEETHRLQSLPTQKISAGASNVTFPLDPWGTTMVSVEQH
jgi:hypothetical protein